VQIALLGPLEVRADSGAPIEVGGSRLRALLIVLALEPGRVVTTARLVDCVWGERPPAGAGNALQALVSRLRRAVPELPIDSQPTGYRLAIAPDAVDVTRFERLAATGRRQLGTDPAQAAETLRAALELWRGPALADVADADFARAPIARLSELRLTTVEHRVTARLRLGVGPALVPELEELVAAHPLREPMVGALMRALCAADRPSAALGVYERAREALASQLGADPSPALSELHLAVLRGDGVPDVSTGSVPAQPAEPAATPAPAPAPPVDARAGIRTNLRSDLTSFVGREAEAARVAGLLDGSRLVTLIGVGGAGKTRLAIEAARSLAERYDDGVWLVELAPVSDPAEVPQAVLAVLGLRERTLLTTVRLTNAEQSTDATDRLASGLATRDLVVVLDNCEHLIDAAAKLADRLLGDCPRVRILATSREPLAITGERLWPVEPLRLPPPDADAATALGCSAIQLFADRAAAVRPGFVVDERTVGPVVRICRALDGMPLAIELAAARLRAMTPEQVAGRLDDRFRLLVGGSRTALPRHRTLQAVVDWSWELLDDAERALWRRLAVFSGGATAAAAEATCAGVSGPGDPVEADRVADLLTALVDKSLLVPAAGAEPRYRMLETIREYGLDRLAEAGEGERVRAAHAAYFRDLAEEAEPKLRGHEQMVWLAKLTDDHDNLYIAVREAVAAGDPDTALRLVAGLGWYWWLRGHRVEGTELALAAAETPGDVPPELRALAYGSAAMNAFASGRGHEDAVAYLDLADRYGGRAASSAAQRYPLLRMMPAFRAMFANGPAFGTRSHLAAMEVLGGLFDDDDPWVGATARMMRAAIATNLGHRYAEAVADCEEALVMFNRLGERWGRSLCLAIVSQLTVLRGEHAEAVEMLRESLAIATDLGTFEDLPQFQASLALTLWPLGRHDEAWAVLAEARVIADRVNLAECSAAVGYAEGELSRQAGDLDAAEAHLADAAAAALGIGTAPQWSAMIAASQAMARLQQGDPDGARAPLGQALKVAQEAGDAPILAQALVVSAELALRTGEAERAAAVLGASAALLGLPQPELIGRTELVGRVRAALGDAFEPAYARGGDATMDTAVPLAMPTPAG
jgi:predicted ATPase/DNA-binding SARP family transcriptional activator